MSAPRYVPEEFRGTDLQAAYLEGFDDGVAQKYQLPSELHPAYCPAEMRAWKMGYVAAIKSVPGGGK